MVEGRDLGTSQRQQGGNPEMEVLRVSAKSNPNSVAGALAGVLRERGGAEIQAIGAGALNQLSRQ